MARAIVTGAAGFIGSHLVSRLLQGGYEVVMIDNFSTGRHSNIEQALAAGGSNKSNASLLELDLATDGRLSDYLADADYIFHLAALADIVPSISNPHKYHRANVEGTIRLLEALRASGSRAKVIYAASSSCYGLAEQIPTPETAPISPQYPYALTKWIAEQYVLHWGQVYGIEAVSLRFFNVYGPRVRTSGTYGAVFGVFLAQMLAGKPLTVVGDGSQSRDFVFVTDVANACVRAAESNISQEVINIGSGAPQSVNRLCELLNHETTPVPRRPGEPDCTWADITKARTLLEWEPVVRFEEGVAQMLAHIEAWRDAPVWTPESIERATEDWFHYLAEPTPTHA